MRKTAAILVIGDEILSGKFVEENARYLIGELRDLGCDLHRIEFIRDDLDEIGESVRRLSSAVDVVFTSGGVGPTHDDVTVAAIARAFGVPVVRHPHIVALLRRYYGGELSDEQLRLAEVPEGSELLEESPRWPVMVFRNLHILPGVPELFRRCFSAVRERFRGAPSTLARVYCRCNETELATPLSAVAGRYPALAFGSYPRSDTDAYQVIITIEGLDADEVGRAEHELRQTLGAHVVKVDRADTNELS